ncbi:hypothetical protein CHS0354_015709 [Potamilus streckersoni]|uniref:Uncharacterized protein n=1 Tax=Potamilus streckersoni TaxID=2493646 RepID=A0AAE0WE40_9BIVA|nr:hypothetical protein CHS0354_015709 [Potamilus streckersoni]
MCPYACFRIWERLDDRNATNSFRGRVIALESDNNVVSSLKPLCEAWSITKPWNAVTCSILQLLRDMDMHLCIDKGIRDDISMMSRLYVKQNNPTRCIYVSTENPQSGSSISTRATLLS